MRILRSYAFRLVITALATPAFGQRDTSALTGTVTDATGASVPAVTVRAIQSGTALERTTQTATNGIYAIPDLPAGKYTVTFAKSEFALLRFENVIQAVGLTRTLDASLSIAGGGQELTVSEPLVLLDQTTASVGADIEKKQTSELPLNGRNWASLTALAPGAFDSGGSNQRSIRFSGRGLDDNNFTLDGVDATGILNQAQRGQVRLAIPTEAIAEFRVESALYSADIGGTAGGQVGVASPSGTNQFHGSAFEYLRNNITDARSPFDGASPAPFRLNQFGGSLGGPIEKSRTFFFMNYEGYRQSLGQTITGFVPGAAFRAGATVGIAPFLNAYPLGNGSAIDASAVTNTYQGLQQANEDSGMIRADRHFNDRLTGFIRYNMDESLSSVPLDKVTSKQDIDARPKNGVAELLQIISPALTNEYKFGVNQEITHTANVSPLSYTLSVPEFSSISNNQTRDERGTTFSWIDNLNWLRGRHLLKAGVEIRYIEMNQGNSFNGTLTYSSLSNFSANRLDQVQQTAMLPLKRLRKTQYSGYLQDEFKIQPNVTLNLGLRYSFFNVFHEVDNRAIPFDFSTCGGYCRAGSAFSLPNYLDFDPRVSVAWSPKQSHGNTVMRSGFAIYHADGQEDDQNLPIANDVQRYNLTRAGFPSLSYPVDAFLTNATGVITPRLLNRRRKDEYVSEWGASLQQNLGLGFVGTASYTGSKGTHLLTTSYVNVLNPLTGARPYAEFGRVEYRGNDNNSAFEALQFSMRRSFRHGMLVSANYMWSHSIDDGSIGGGEADFPQNVSCRACERASSDQDVRQTFTINAVYEIPGAHAFVGLPIARRILGGWELAAIGTARTGLPVTVTVDRNSSDLPDGNSASQRPNVAPGVSLIPAGGQTPQDWINLAAFATPAAGTWGNAGRNLVRAPGTWQTDLALDRRFAVTERAELRFRVEVFNMFNRAQYGSPLADISAPSSFGRITSLVNNGATGSGTPRRFQFALRVTF